MIDIELYVKHENRYQLAARLRVVTAGVGRIIIWRKYHFLCDPNDVGPNEPYKFYETSAIEFADHELELVP